MIKKNLKFILLYIILIFNILILLCLLIRHFFFWLKKLFINFGVRGHFFRLPQDTKIQDRHGIHIYIDLKWFKNYDLLERMFCQM